MRRNWKAALAAPAVLAAVALAAAPAQATFHLKCPSARSTPARPRTPAASTSSCRCTRRDRISSAATILRTYSAAGVTTTTTLPADVKGGANQSTILIAGGETEATFPGIVPDAFLKGVNLLDPAGGAVCWENLDCVSWGSFSGSVLSPAGGNAPAIPDGNALRRTIAPGCASLLEMGDDHNDSATDFAVVFPNPRPNSAVPAEHACPSGGPGGGGGAPDHSAQTPSREADA